MLAGLVSLGGDVLTTEKYLIGSRMKPDEVLDDLDAAINRLLAQVDATRDDLAAFGCSTPGVIRAETGVIAMNHNVGWVDVPLGDLLHQRFGVPVALEMDANAAALGEYWQGAAKGFNNFAFVIVGTGVGAGIVLNQQPLHGAHGVAGEIGHTVLIPNGPLCGCGKHGCLEALSSGLAIARKANAALMLGRATALQQYEAPLTAKDVVEAARAGDPLACEIIDEAGYYLGIALANFVTLFDPEAIVLGGGLGYGAYDLLYPALQKGFQPHLNLWAARDTPILQSIVGDDYAGLLGAAYAAHSLISHVKL